MSKTAQLKNSAVQVLKSSAKLPAVKRQREYGDFDDFVANADKLVAFFKQVDQDADRLNDIKFEWLDRPYSFDPEQAKREITRANILVRLACNALTKFPPMRKRLASFKFDERWFNRKELYERKGEGWRLSRRVVSEQLAILASSFLYKANVSEDEAKAFARMLIEEVCAAKPNACVLESACRFLRRDENNERGFAPSIAKVLKTIKQESSAWVERWEWLDSDDGDIGSDVFFQRHLEKAIVEAESMIAKAQTKLAEHEVKQQAAAAKRQAYREAYERIPVQERRAYELGQRSRFPGKYRPPMPVEYMEDGHEREAAAYVAGKHGQPIPGMEIKNNGSGLH
jgi:hypothetical protein